MTGTATGEREEPPRSVSGHPCPWTPAILDCVEPMVEAFGLPVHDPFAGAGERLSQLCDRVGVGFSGTEIEAEFIIDDRVRPGDSTDANSYPGHEHLVVTSPVYPNGMADHFHRQDGTKGYTYRQALARIIGHDRPLHPNNMGRYSNHHRGSRRTEATHFDLAARCVEHWPDIAIVNVKNVVADAYCFDVAGHWRDLLTAQGYEVERELAVPTPGHRNGANRHLRADHEVVLVARRRDDGGAR